MDRAVYAARRARVLERLGGSVLVLPAAPVFRRNGDTDHPYRQESDLLYLTGFREPESVLVLTPHRERRATLFVRQRDKEMETWNGRRAGVDGAVRDYGMDDAFIVGDLERELPRLLVGATSVHYPYGLDPAFDARMIKLVTELKNRHRGALPVPDRIQDLGQLVHGLRLVKDPGEVALLERAAALTHEGFLHAMRATRPGVAEYEVEAELLYRYRKGGGDGPGYEPIVASGVNATILHYRTGRDVLRDGDVLLVDSGCEYLGYTADVTRTWPVGPRFSREQQALYEVVLAAHADAVAAVRPGASREAVHEVACRTLIRGLLDLKLLTGTVDECWADKSFRRFYMHGTSHWLGMDVHDAGGYTAGGSPRPLAPGFVLTVEPGLYVAEDDPHAPPEWRGIGIRIEDDVLVTPTGHRVLTDQIPRTIAEMEAVRR